MGSLRAAIPFGLFALNLMIGWRLFNQEYTAHYDSIEPFFYALADYLKANWLHPGWWKEWNCGMPFRYTYQPLLHYSVAAVGAMAHWSSARAFHFTLGLFYAAGPVTLYLLVLRLSGRVRVALTSALLYSLWSPSALLMPDVAADIDGFWNARRLHTAVIYGDGPHVAGLTLVPLALLLLDRAARRWSPAKFLLAALATVAVPLTNIPAAMVLAMVLIAYCLAADPMDRLPRMRAVAISSVLGYLLAAPLLPPSEFALVAQNTQWMDQAGKMTAAKFLMIVAGPRRVLQLLSHVLPAAGSLRMHASPCCSRSSPRPSSSARIGAASPSSLSPRDFTSPWKWPIVMAIRFTRGFRQDVARCAHRSSLPCCPSGK